MAKRRNDKNKIGCGNLIPQPKIFKHIVYEYKCTNNVGLMYELHTFAYNLTLLTATKSAGFMRVCTNIITLKPLQLQLRKLR